MGNIVSQWLRCKGRQCFGTGEQGTVQRGMLDKLSRVMCRPGVHGFLSITLLAFRPSGMDPASTFGPSDTYQKQIENGNIAHLHLSMAAASAGSPLSAAL
jgi:hypothetical protein